MEKKKLTIDDLLEALKTPTQGESVLLNTTEIWARIGERDRTLAHDFGISESELDSVLKDWIKDNPYNNIGK